MQTQGEIIQKQKHIISICVQKQKSNHLLLSLSLQIRIIYFKTSRNKLYLSIFSGWGEPNANGSLLYRLQSADHDLILVHSLPPKKRKLQMNE